MSFRRRDVIAGAGALALAATCPTSPLGAASASAFPSKRPPKGQRRFTSPAVESEIARVKAKIADPQIGWLFENCYPNTLDTTAELGTIDGQPDTFVITGDIDAMWLRDSSAQLQTYVHLTPKDAALRRLFHGLIQRQARCILIDPYANAFMKDPAARSSLPAISDRTDMKPGVAERKWEIDSLCYPMRLAHGYWTATRDKAPFDALWAKAMARAVATLREQQRKDGPGPYHFQRIDKSPTETLMFDGHGAPTRKVGLIHSGFRPSDDACFYPFLIPSNLFAMSALRMLAQVLNEARDDAAARRIARRLQPRSTPRFERMGRWTMIGAAVSGPMKWMAMAMRSSWMTPTCPACRDCRCSARRSEAIRCGRARRRSPGADAIPISSPVRPPRALVVRISAWT